MIGLALALMAAQDGQRMVAPGPLLRSAAQAMVARRFAEMDVNGDGGVDRAEADTAAAAVREAAAAHPGRRMVSDIPGSGPDTAWFAATDADQDGRVTLAELSVAPLANFDRLDTDHDGTLSAEERAADAALRRRPG